MSKLPSLFSLAGAVLLLTGAGCAQTARPTPSPESAPQPAAMQQIQPTTEERMESQPAMATTSVMTSTSTPTAESARAVPTHGNYEAYEPSLLQRAKTEKVVLFFYAPWCPTCRTVDTDIKNRLNDLPSDLSLSIVDYDSSTELKKEYGVTYQHTFVQVDEAGNMLKKWSGGSTLQSILAQLN